MQVYNTLTQKKEAFVPLNNKNVSMYLCGPTVYDAAHLGHGRSAVAFDIIRRYLTYKGFEVNFVSNYTDIDDKMINRAKEKGITVAELTEQIIPLYERDYGALKVQVPTTQPRATEYIEQIITIIHDLEKKGSVYVIEDDGVYFDIAQFSEYGKLSKQNLEELQMGARVEVNDKKRNPQDFALWKFEKPGEPAWESPWGKGRPGWHIECSAMSMSLLGETIDIHGGGADLMFPHHECEIAQSEKSTNKPFVKYWLHNGFINIDNEKMSKSLGNFITLHDVLQKYSGDVVRFAYIQYHYRSPINFTDDLFEQSKNSLTRIHDFVRMVEQQKEIGEAQEEIEKIVVSAQDNFENAMDDDFETPGAFAALFTLIKEVNTFVRSNQLTSEDQKLIISFLQKIDEVFDIIFTVKEDTIDNEIETLIKEREEARKNKNYARSDEIRDELLEKGIVLEDTPNGTIWKKVN